MNLMALVGAAFGAVVGALVWALISALTGYEVGYVAWGVGALVGFGASILGSRGHAIGAVCAVLALAAIFAGKVISAQVILQKEVREKVQAQLTRAAYDELCSDAAEFVKLKGEEEYARYMTQRGFTEAKTPGEVPPEELARFKEWRAPRLRELAETKPAFEDWRKNETDETTAQILAQAPIVNFVVRSLNAIDLLFAFLGIATAFRIASGATAAARAGRAGTPAAPQPGAEAGPPGQAGGSGASS